MPGETYLDEACLRSQDLSEDFASLVGLLKSARTHDIRPRMRTDGWYAPVTDDMTLSDVIFGDAAVDADVRGALREQISALRTWDTEPEHAGVSSREFAVTRVSQTNTIACFVLRKFSSAPDRAVHILANASEIHAPLRQMLERDVLTEEEFVARCSKVFPHLLFKPGIAADIRCFSKGFELRADLVQAFADLNDHLPQLFASGLGAGDIQSRFEAASRFGFSLESPLTHRNAKAMRERDVVYQGQKLRCEWHVKLEPTRDRIHVCPINAHANKERSVFVGIFCEHLTT